MKTAKYLLLTAILSTGISYAQSTAISLSTYAVPIVYSNSVAKNDGFTTGAYLYFGYTLSHLFEAELDFTRINFKDGNTLNQYDFTFSYTNFSYPYRKIRTGIHLIQNNEKDITPQTDTNGGIIAFLGYSKYKPYKWEAGAEGYISYYKNYDVGGQKLTVLQTNVYFTYSEGNYYKEGRASITLRPYLIYIPKSPTGQNSYISLEGSFNYYIQRWIFSGIGYVGTTAFPVKNGGFLVYNVAEEREYGLGLAVRYILNKRASVGAGFFSERFQDENSTNKANLTTVNLNLSYAF